MKRLLALALLLVLLGLWRCSGEREIPRSPGVLVPEAPVQVDLRAPPAFSHGDFSIQPLADFRLRARVLAREDYRFDPESRLSPIDLALGWGRMSDSAVLAGLRISQSGRFYYYRWDQAGPPIPLDEIVRSSANMHLVPANGSILAAMRRVRPGDVVRIDGQLIEATRGDGWRWRSSLTREDSGAGACELIWVTGFSIEGRK